MAAAFLSDSWDRLIRHGFRLWERRRTSCRGKRVIPECEPRASISPSRTKILGLLRRVTIWYFIIGGNSGFEASDDNAPPEFSRDLPLLLSQTRRNTPGLSTFVVEVTCHVPGITLELRQLDSRSHFECRPTNETKFEILAKCR